MWSSLLWLVLASRSPSLRYFPRYTAGRLGYPIRLSYEFLNSLKKWVLLERRMVRSWGKGRVYGTGNLRRVWCVMVQWISAEMCWALTFVYRRGLSLHMLRFICISQNCPELSSCLTWVAQGCLGILWQDRTTHSFCLYSPLFSAAMQSLLNINAQTISAFPAERKKAKLLESL